MIGRLFGDLMVVVVMRAGKTSVVDIVTMATSSVSR